MTLNLLKYISCLSILLLPQFVSAQVETNTLLPIQDKNKIFRNAINEVPLKVLATCGADTILYPYHKEIQLSSGQPSFKEDDLYGNVRTASQAYHLNNEIRIKGVKFWGYAYSIIPNLVKNIDVEIGLWSVDEFNKPIALLESASITVTEKAGMYHGLFAAPFVYNQNFAVTVRSIPVDTLTVIANNAGAPVHTKQYGEDLAWRRYGSGTWFSTRNFFGQDREYMIFPIVEYDQPTVDLTTSSGCTNQSVTLTSNSSSLYDNRMFNLIEFDRLWFNKTDTTFAWNFGDNSAAVKGNEVSHTYTDAGTYTVAMTGSMLGYRSKCNVSTTKEITIIETPKITAEPSPFSSCPGEAATFTVEASGDNLTYQWQLESGGSYTDVPNEAPYSGETSTTLSISDGHLLSTETYQVVVSNSCGSATSDPVILSTEDNTDPVFSSCPSNVSISAETYTYTSPAATDNCSSNVTVTMTEGLASGATFPEGETTISFEAEDESGNTTACSFTVTRTIPTAVMKKASLIRNIYPNPASDYIHVQVTEIGNEKFSAEIKTTEGTVIRQNSYTSSDIRIDISDLQPGIYFIHIQSDRLKGTEKIIVY